MLEKVNNVNPNTEPVVSYITKQKLLSNNGSILGTSRQGPCDGLVDESLNMPMFITCELVEMSHMKE